MSSTSRESYDEFAMARSKKTTELFVRNFIFGVEDSLVSTVGFISGVAAGGLSKGNIFLAGMVLIFVEAFSMGVGSYLSEDSAEQFVEKKKDMSNNTIIAAVIMFVSYFICGMIPLSPYIVLEVSQAFPISIIFSLIALFLLGSLSARYFKRNWLTHGIKMMLIGGLAIAAGIVVASFI